MSHVLAMRDKLASMTQLVQKNLKNAQQTQKRWYDRTAREREFQSGDQVLVLLPTSTSTLLAKWRGPYRVLKREGKVTYLVDMHDACKRKRILHVNMLRQWHTPAATSFFAEGAENEDEEDGDFPEWRPSGAKEPQMGEQLTVAQQKDLATLLHNCPGRTTLIEHQITSGDAHPIRLPPYRVPHAYRATVQSELQDMLDTGIIEPSRSEWASPMVIVRKKDGGIRVCVDYRRLNSVTAVDPYPMPRTDDLIDRLGCAKYISTLDLSRGYWQVPVAESDRPKTSFTTSMGLFQFRVMPFGLSGAPATFQRMMDRLLQGTDDFAAAYLDDLVVYSDTWEAHCHHLRQVLQRLSNNGLTAKPAKCQLGMRKCVYLGHVVGNGQVCPEESKLKAVESFAVPATK